METQETNEATINDPQAVLSALDRAKSDAKKNRERAEELEAIVNERNTTIAQF